MNPKRAVWCKVYGHTRNYDESKMYMNMDGNLFPNAGTPYCGRCGRVEKTMPFRLKKRNGIRLFQESGR